MVRRLPSISRRTIRASERGSVVVITVAWTVLALFALGAIGYFHGLASLERLRAQVRSDALALGSAEAFRMYGLNHRCDIDYGGEFINELHTLNGGDGLPPCPVGEPKVDDRWMLYAFQDSQIGRIEGEFGQWGVDTEITRRGRAMRLYELVTDYDDFFPIYPNVELVLDYSASMEDPMTDGGDRTRVEQLRRALNSFFLRARNVNVGLTLFATSTVASRRIRELTFNHKGVLRRAIENNDPPFDEVNGKTNYAEGLRVARNKLIGERWGARIIFFVSDGKPTVPSPAEGPRVAREMADNVKRSVDQIWGLYVGDRDGEGVMRDIVTDPNQNLLTNNTPEAYQDFFRNFAFDYVCRLEIPVDRSLDGGFPAERTTAWIRRRNAVGGPGIPLEYVPNQDLLFEENNQDVHLRYRYTIFVPDGEDELYVHISQGACEQLLDRNYEFVFRAGYTMLAALNTEL